MSTAACLVGPAEDRFAVEVGELRVVGTAPLDDATDVPTDVVFDLCFDGIIAPAAVDPRAAQLLAGTALFDSRADVLLAAWRPPMSREGIATTRWCPGSVLRVTPVSPLRPDTPYRIRLDTSVLGWSGETLIPEGPGWINDRGEPALIVSFSTAAARTPEPDSLAAPPAAEAEPSEPPSLVDLFASGGPFDPERDTCSCHREPGPARALVDLTSPERAAATLLREGPERVVFPGRASESPLLHVTIRDAEGAPLPGPRSGPMPPDDSDVAPWSHADVSRVAAWIDGGARP